MSTHAADISRDEFVEAKLPEVVAEQVSYGNVDVFWEALGPDGFDQYFSGRMNGEAAKEKKLAELREAIADEDYEQVGKIVTSFVTAYFEDIAYDDISDNLEAYGYYD